MVLTCTANFFLIASSVVIHVPTFTITDAKLNASVVTLSTQDNAKLLEQLGCSFKRTTIYQ